MNIILEGGVNFYDELNKSDSEVDDEEEECCLITNYPLDKNSITLQCNHKFNLLPLYKEVCNQKCKASHLEITKLKMNEIKCPYCRQRHNKLLPHVKLNNTMSYIHGVNSPEEYCMSLYSCEYTYKSGKNKGNACSNNAYINVDGCYCNTHHKYMEKKLATSKKDEINKCSAILKSGKRKGMSCGCKISDKTNEFCNRHTPK